MVAGIIASNRKRYGVVKPDTKMIVFLMMKNIVKRGVATFFNILRNKNIESCYDEEDIACELYLVVCHCIDKFDVNQKSKLDGKPANFYFFCNSAVTNYVQRTTGYKRITDEVTFSKFMSNTRDDFNADDDDKEVLYGIHDGAAEKNLFSGMMMTDLNNILADKHKAVVAAILRNEKQKDILEELGLSKAEYKSLKEEIGLLILNMNGNGFNKERRGVVDNDGVGTGHGGNTDIFTRRNSEVHQWNGRSA